MQGGVPAVATLPYWVPDTNRQLPTSQHPSSRDTRGPLVPF